MFRTSLFPSRSAIGRSETLCCLCQRTFHSKSRLEKEGGRDLYSELLADINTKNTNVNKRRPRQKTSQLDSASTETEAPKKTRRATSKPKSTDITQDGEQAEKVPKKRRIWKRPSLEAELTPEKLKVQAELKEIKTQRIPLSLLENPWTDVTRYLKSAYRSQNALGDTKRAHVISESLCDDALQRLEPTLERHVGCDIIDINPGVCLWSSKLHERLKPRKHILLEPDQKLYRPFTLPLLMAPDSKYELVAKSGIVWSHLETVLSKQSLPYQDRLEGGDPRLEEKNDTLLVLANLGYYPMKPYRGFTSLASLVLYQFMTAARAHSLFQRYGLVRFMVWTNDEEKRHLLPREIHQRRKTAVEAELTFEKINEVASTTVDKSPYQRDKSYDTERGHEVLKKMKAAEIFTPEGRESILLRELTTPEKTQSDEPEGLWSMSKAAVEELVTLEKAFNAGQFPEKVEVGAKMKQNPTHKRYRLLRTQLNFVTKRLELFATLMREYDGLAALQKVLHARKAEDVDTSEQEAQFHQAKETWYDQIELLPEHYRDRMLYLLDNHRTVAYNSPLLLYDRRDYEPLLVREEEFFPAHPMCLLDFQPRSIWPILREDRGGNKDIFEYILGSFFHLPTQSVKKALKATWPGAYEWIIEQCPSLTNPLKGGALDLDMLNVRTLTEEMLKEIITAWAKWPFKPSRHELVSRIGAAGYDPDEKEVD